MTALIIILSILAVIAVLLLFSVSLYIDYNADETTVWVKYLFFKIPVYPRKKKKSKKKKSEKENKEPEKKNEDKKENFFVTLAKGEGLGAVVEILVKIIQIVRDFSSSTIKQLKIKKLKIDVIAGGEDASDTAVNFGNACSAVYPVLGVLSGIITFVDTPDVNIAVDYDKKETTANLFLHMKMQLIFIIAIILVYGIKAVLLYINITKADTIEEASEKNSDKEENKSA